MTTVKYDPQWVRDFYADYGMKEWDRWDSPCGQVRWHIHLHYLRQAIKPGDRVLEIGAGPGRFTQELAKITSRIVVADISPVQLALNRQQAALLDFDSAIEDWVECDVCDLRGHFAEDEFDAVVCYGGAISYVFEQAEEAILELKRVTKPGGAILLEVMALWGAIHSALQGVLTIPSEKNRQIVASGDLLPEMQVSTHMVHMYRAGEFRQLIERTGLALDVLTTSNALSTHWDSELSELPADGDTWQHLLELELEACREPGCLDLGTHLVAVCRKPA